MRTAPWAALTAASSIAKHRPSQTERRREKPVAFEDAEALIQGAQPSAADMFSIWGAVVRPANSRIARDDRLLVDELADRILGVR